MADDYTRKLPPEPCGSCEHLYHRGQIEEYFVWRWACAHPYTGGREEIGLPYPCARYEKRIGDSPKYERDL